MEFMINGNTYRSGKLDAFQQQDLAFALVPAFSAVAPLLKDILPVSEDGTGGDEIADIRKTKLMDSLPVILPALTTAVRTLDKKSRKEINDICLDVVTRQTGNQWSKIYSGGVLMYDDINGIELLQIVGYVIKDSLGSFFPAPPENDAQA
ncbi:phage tail assembly chaperone [Morganella morganii]|uniref:phage tail assembly chaperone n=1 Tax=Morganella morganii TaxID=582 RepID=UPI0031A58DD4